MKLETFAEVSGDWLEADGPESDVVLSSRIRLARNIRGRVFPHRIGSEGKREIVEEVRSACERTEGLADSAYWDLESLSEAERQVFVERHLASPHLVGSAGPRGVVVGPGEGRGVMVNEEDHVRIQSVVSGLNLGKALETAVGLDRELEEALDFAVSDDRGYLTACPTNVGTGLRASVLVHLPGLVLAGEIKKVHRAVAEMGMAVRGWFGEGTSALGDYYQLSNQRTLGRTEEEASEQLEKVARRVLELEIEARRRLGESEDRRRRMDDRVHRSRGILESARLLTVEQVMGCASDLRLGRWLGTLPDVDLTGLNRLALFAQPAHLGLRLGRSLSGDDESWARAEWIRAEIGAVLGNPRP